MKFRRLKEAYDNTTIKNYFDDAWDKYSELRDALYAFENAVQGNKDLEIASSTFIRDIEEAAGNFWTDYQYYTKQEDETEESLKEDVDVRSLSQPFLVKKDTDIVPKGTILQYVGKTHDDKLIFDDVKRGRKVIFDDMNEFEYYRNKYFCLAEKYDYSRRK